MAKEVEQYVLMALDDHYHELDDTEDAPFGEYARVTTVGNRMVIAHETDDSIQVEVIVRALSSDDDPTTGLLTKDDKWA